MNSFYKSAWILQLQHAYHLRFMEEIKAQIMYKPPDRFSIMSAFEDVDDHFTGHKTRSSSLPYRTLDEELQIFFSSGNSTASQDVRKDTRVVSGARGQSQEQDQGTVSLEHSSAKRRPAAEMQAHLHLDSSIHQCHGTAEHCGHAASGGKILTLEPETVPNFQPCSPRGSDNAQLGRPAFSQESDTQRNSDCPVSKSDSQKCLAVKKEQSTMTSPKANLTDTESGGILQQTCTMGFKTEDVPRTLHTNYCSCGMPKVDKACQSQPEVVTVGTWCDDKIMPDQLQGGDHGSIQIMPSGEKLWGNPAHKSMKQNCLSVESSSYMCIYTVRLHSNKCLTSTLISSATNKSYEVSKQRQAAGNSVSGKSNLLLVCANFQSHNFGVVNSQTTSSLDPCLQMQMYLTSSFWKWITFLSQKLVKPCCASVKTWQRGRKRTFAACF